MENFTQLMPVEPIVVPPKESVIYDSLWIDMLTLTSTEVNKITLYCKMIPCRELSNGEMELKSPLSQEDIKVITMDNLWIKAQKVPSLAIAMEAVFQAVNDYGRLVGVISNPQQVI